MIEPTPEQARAQKEIEELLKLKPNDPEYDDYFKTK